MSKNIETPKTCRCGCDREIGRRSVYAPGHDAKHVSELLPVLRREVLRGAGDAKVEHTEANIANIFAALGSPALRAKLGRAFDNETDLSKDEQGYYNTAGDAGILVPFSENPSLGKRSGFAEATLKAYEALGWTLADGGTGSFSRPKAEPKSAAEVNVAAQERGGVAEYKLGEVKIGRWTYPSRTNTATGEVQRNEKRDGSGAWVKVGA